MTGGWIERWGEGNPERWLEAELALRPGGYKLRRTSHHIVLRDERDRRDRELDVYELSGPTGHRRSVAMTELSNGIWVVAYRTEDER